MRKWTKCTKKFWNHFFFLNCSILILLLIWKNTYINYLYCIVTVCQSNSIATMNQIHSHSEKLSACTGIRPFYMSLFYTVLFSFLITIKWPTFVWLVFVKHINLRRDLVFSCPKKSIGFAILVRHVISLTLTFYHNEPRTWRSQTDYFLFTGAQNRRITKTVMIASLKSQVSDSSVTSCDSRDLGSVTGQGRSTLATFLTFKFNFDKFKMFSSVILWFNPIWKNEKYIFERERLRV